MAKASATFVKNTVCSKLEILWVRTPLYLSRDSQWIPGSVQQDWDNLDSSHATGFQTDVRRRRPGAWVSAASCFAVDWVNMCFEFGGLKSPGKGLWETWEQQCNAIHSGSLWGACSSVPQTRCSSCAVPACTARIQAFL